MGEFLALISAVFFGATHFLNGLFARRVDSAAVAFLGQLGGTALMVAVAPFFAAPNISVSALGWGTLSGVGTGLAVAFLYRGMSHGRFSVVVPLSDVAAVALPVLVGVALLGDRPNLLAWGGIAAAPFALWLISPAPAAPMRTPAAPLPPEPATDSSPAVASRCSSSPSPKPTPSPASGRWSPAAPHRSWSSCH